MRLIDADALLKKLPREELVSRMIVSGMPTIDPALRDKENGITYAPVKLGRWELVDEAEPRRYGCSRCKRLSWTESNYCPFCGARMEEQE